VINLTTAKPLPKKILNDTSSKLSTPKKKPVDVKKEQFAEAELVAEQEAIKAAQKGDLGTVTTPGGRRSTRIAAKRAKPL